MKRLFVVIGAVALIGMILAGCGSPATKVRIGIAQTFRPFATVDNGTRKLVGFDIDLMTAIAARANLEVEFVTVRIGALVAGVAQCQYDGGIAALTITDDLRQQMNFSDPYFAAGPVIVIKEGNVAITSRATLSGKTVGTQIDTPSADAIVLVAGAQLKTYPSFDLAFQDLTHGLIDAVVADNPLAQRYAGETVNHLKIVGEAFSSEGYGIAVCQQQADVLKKINAGLAAVKADGALDTLAQKWGIGNKP